jgi:penicillin amidase
MNLTTLLLKRAVGARLPLTRGTLILPGLHAPVTIRRDRYGIPHIEAQDDHDAWFGMGFCQAQDRAFQLELRLRTQRGTLSELFGEATLGIDRLSRRIGFVDSSRKQLPVLDDEARGQIEAFVMGINAGLFAGSPKAAPEFALLRATPTPWLPEDVLGQGKLLSFLLIGNWDVELARYKILTADGPQALRDLDPTPYPDDHPVAISGTAAGPAIDRLSEDIEQFLSFAGAGGGSNAWVVSGARTASGRPILANDPHLEAAMPPHWYLAQIRTPDWAVAGAALIGAPAIGAGHNGYAAWGVTAGLVDTVDLFIEDVGPDGRSVRRGEGYEPCDLRREVIKVRGRSPVTEDVLVTPRGPVIGPALAGEVGAISMRAVWLDARPARGFLFAHKARSFEAFRAEFAQWPLLSQNVVYADESGRIGWQLVGEVPVRRKGWGTLPLPGADPETGWQDEGVPFESMPYVVDPESGYLATANNKPARDEEKAPFLGVDWLDGYRAGRITAALGHRDDWDLDSTARLQLDELSLPWREIGDIISGLPAVDADALLAQRLLGEWDGVVSADSPAASVYERFLRNTARRIARARAPNSAEWALGRGFTDLLTGTTFTGGRSSRVVRRIKQQPNGWFDSWQDELLGALVDAVQGLRRDHGQRVEDWAWGKVRPITLPHPFGRVKALAPVFNRGPFPWGGDGDTVSQAGGNDPVVIASLRFVVEVGDWENARFVLPGGQSGNPFSPHYDDMLPLWQRGEGVPIAFSQEAVYDASVEALRLEPMARGDKVQSAEGI